MPTKTAKRPTWLSWLQQASLVSDPLPSVTYRFATRSLAETARRDAANVAGDMRRGVAKAEAGARDKVAG
jgi:hypothetical protein